MKGTGYNIINTPTKDAQQLAWRDQIMGGIGPGTNAALQGLSGIASGDESYFKQLEAPAWRQLGQAQSQMANRFSGMGSGARHSSGFQNAESGLSSDFAQQLQSQRMGLQQNAWQQLLGMGKDLFNSDMFDTHFLPKKKSFWEEMFGNMSSGVGQGIGMLPYLAMM